MKILIDGTHYDYDTKRLTMTEAFEMKERTGHGLVAFELAWDSMEPEALAWVAYLAKRRAGEKVEWGFEFDVAAMVDDLYGDEEPEAVDPTQPTSPPSEPTPDEPLPDETAPKT